MMFPSECPLCESADTEVVHTEFSTHVIERVRVCNDCPAEFSVTFGDPSLYEVRDGDGEVVGP